MTQEQWDNLDIGDIVRHCTNSNGMIVVQKTPLIFIKTVTPTNLQEWDLILKSHLERIGD